MDGWRESAACDADDVAGKSRPGVGTVSPVDPAGLEERIDALENALDRIASELRTRRLVVVDEHGRERIVGEIVAGHCELRLDLPDLAAARRSSVLVYSSPERHELGEGVGLQVWAGGDAVWDVAAWRDGNGDWALRQSTPGD